MDKTTDPPPSCSVSVSKPPTPSSALGRAKTDLPHLPRDTQPVIGNKSYERALCLSGRLGFCRDRANTARPEVNVTVNASAYGQAIIDVLKHVLTDLAHLKNELSTARCESVAVTLSHGVLVMTYLKLRAINLFRPDETHKFCPKPKVPNRFEVPTPFGFAISQLGVVEVSSLPRRKICYPTLDEASASTYMCPLKTDWNQTADAEAVGYAKSLGMDFTTVDLSIKVGSSWWLFKPRIVDGLFSLRCILPEDNYTLAGAVVYMLFHVTATSDAVTEIFNLGNIKDADYGSFIRRPRDGFNYSAYYAITKERSDD